MKEAIDLARSEVNLNQAVSLEDLEEELMELLMNPDLHALSKDETSKSRTFSQDPRELVASVTTAHSVPGLWQAAPKKGDKQEKPAARDGSQQRL